MNRPKKWHMQVGPPVYNTEEVDLYIDELEGEIEALTTGCDRLIDALKQIDRLDHTHSATNCSAYYAGLIARKALDAYRAEYPRTD